MKMIQLKSSDNETFEIEEEAASGSQTIKNMIEDECTDSAIPLPNVNSKILAKIVEYLKKHAVSANAAAVAVSDEEKKAAAVEEAFNKELVNVDQNTLFDLILAANYLSIQSLLDLTCRTVANMMKGKTAEEIRATFNIKNDFTAEEEAEVRRENAWAFE